jgi:Fe2+ transport system protein B
VWTDRAGALYDQAAAAQWDPAALLEWDRPITHDPRVEAAVVQVMTFLIENEEAALVVPARFLGEVHPHFREIQQVLAVNVADEARHIEVFTRRAVKERCILFLQKAGTVILAVSVVLWFLASYPAPGPELDHLHERLDAVALAGDEQEADAVRREISGATLRNSFAGRAGRFLEPAIEPLGFDWKIGIALITSFAAREVMVSTMATVFNLDTEDEGFTTLREKMRTAVDPQTGALAYSPLMAVSLMVFFVLACQCMSTVAVVRRETNGWTWPIFMVVMMNALAYGTSLLVFQGGKALGLG